MTISQKDRFVERMRQIADEIQSLLFDLQPEDDERGTWRVRDEATYARFHVDSALRCMRTAIPED